MDMEVLRQTRRLSNRSEQGRGEAVCRLQATFESSKRGNRQLCVNTGLFRWGGDITSILETPFSPQERIPDKFRTHPLSFINVIVVSCYEVELSRSVLCRNYRTQNLTEYSNLRRALCSVSDVRHIQETVFLFGLILFTASITKILTKEKYCLIMQQWNMIIKWAWIVNRTIKKTA